MHSCMHIICAQLDSQSNLRLSTNSASAPPDAWHWRILKAITKAMETSSNWNSIGSAVFRAVVARSMLQSQVSACYTCLGSFSQGLVRGSKIPTLAFPWLATELLLSLINVSINSLALATAEALVHPAGSKVFSYVLTVFFFLLMKQIAGRLQKLLGCTWLWLFSLNFLQLAWTYCMMMLKMSSPWEHGASWWIEQLKNSRRTPCFVIAKQGLAKPSTSWCPLQLPPADWIPAATLWIQCHGCKKSTCN